MWAASVGNVVAARVLLTHGAKADVVSMVRLFMHENHVGRAADSTQLTLHTRMVRPHSCSSKRLCIDWPVV